MCDLNEDWVENWGLSQSKSCHLSLRNAPVLQTVQNAYTANTERFFGQYWLNLGRAHQNTGFLPFSSSWNIKFLGTHWFPASGSLNCCHSVWVNWDMLQTALNFSNAEISAQMTVLPSLCPFSLLPHCWIRGWDFWVHGWDFCNSCKAGAEHSWKSLLFYQVWLGLEKSLRICWEERRHNSTWGKRAVLSLETIPRPQNSLDFCSFLHYTCKHQCLFLVFIPYKSQ